MRWRSSRWSPTGRQMRRLKLAYLESGEASTPSSSASIIMCSASRPCRATSASRSAEAAQELVADVEDRVRPGALRQVLDDLAHALVAVDQDHVAGANDAEQSVEVVGQEEGIVAARLGQRGQPG